MLLLMISSVLAASCDNGPVLPQANPVRTLPTVVFPGDEFEVTVTFASPSDGFWNIALEDSAPVDWMVTANETWCAPDAFAAAPVVPWTINKAEYLWDPLAVYDQGQAFTAVYRIRVPDGAIPATYAFDGTLEYYVGEIGAPYQEGVTGDSTIGVEAASPP